MSRSTEPDPTIKNLDVLIVDWQGGLRGKRLPLQYKNKILEAQVRMPLSTQAMDIWGDDCDEITGLGLSSGDPDGFCLPSATSFQRQPWNANNEQILCTLLTAEGVPSEYDVRALLQSQVKRLQHSGLHPVVAVELEFYVLDASTRTSGKPTVPRQLTVADTPNELQLYDMRAMDNMQELLSKIQSYAHLMNIPVETQLAEFGPGQFEINLKHQSNPVLAADQAVLFKQLVDRAASECNLLASFMAKPYSQHGGSGQHVHVSLLDDKGGNVFDQPDGQNLLHGVAGALGLLEETQLLFAPHANSYRRLQPSSFAPVRIDWGYDHRGVAVRIPESQGPGARIEHRVAGADANPYLVLTALLGAIAHGIEGKLKPDIEPLLPGQNPTAPLMTHDWLCAIERFEQSAWARQLLGSAFHSKYAAIKRHEALSINKHVTDIELDTYLSRI